ncbi:hypothetical protein BU23DRAFT_575700 [Bimuria novae-zelandiae CBS 107.79]|uniref:Uncharacterized protein n=1 Tax=Bimuria novae-zelandiae CBS 107.79 TaxID=1447943 RepID=A0A6A5UIG3_9PLEO|nr:hypothetical protein BU23DRAFT_575700 [Bimuria novae-zelandiae CBS 107.79]
MDMRGWIELGSFLTETADYGSELVALENICDQLKLKRRVVYQYLLKLSDPDRMAWTQIAHVTREGELAGKSNLDTLEHLQSALHDLFNMAERIVPTPGSIFEKRKMKSSRGPMSEQLPKEVKQALHLTYLYEAMLLERPVPLARYGILPDPGWWETPSATAVRDASVTLETECQFERSFSSLNLRSQNRYLRAEAAQLRKENRSLAETNEKLALQVATCSRPLANSNSRPPGGPHDTSHNRVSENSSSYEDLFKSLDRPPVLTRPLLHPGTGQALSHTIAFEGDCPTFRPPRSRTPQLAPHSRSATLPVPPKSPMGHVPASPSSPLKSPYSTSSHGYFPNDTNIPRYSPSPSSSTKSNATAVTSPTNGTGSRSSSSGSRRSPRPGSSLLPAQPGRFNSIAEMHARQANIVNVQQPIGPYAEVLEKARYAVTGIVRRKSSGVSLENAGEPSVERRGSFARLGEVFGSSRESSYDGGGRRESTRETDISKNF